MIIFSDFRTREKDDACALKKSLSSSVVGLINVSSLVSFSVVVATVECSLAFQYNNESETYERTRMGRRRRRGGFCHDN